MLNPSKKYKKTQQILQEAVVCIFAAQFPSQKFFSLLLEISEDPDLQTPAILIFSMYNILVLEESEVSMNGLSKIDKNNHQSLANVAGGVLKSTYLAHKKNYKDSLQVLKESINICFKEGIDKEFNRFYDQVIGKMIQIHDFGAFKKDYLSLIEQILTQFKQSKDNLQILKALTNQREVIKQKVCTLNKKASYPSLLSRSNMKSGQKSSASRQKSEKSEYFNEHQYRPKTFKKRTYVNPYEMIYKKNDKNECAFM